MDAFNDGRALQRLLDELGRLPGIGPKSAQRIAYYLLEADTEEARRLSNAIMEVKQQVHFCPVCFSYATRDTCDVCADSTRDRSEVCVVSEPRDVQAIERTGTYHGLYHVLGGVIAPMDGIGPQQLNMESLFQRVESGTVGEVILALPATVDGDTTNFYIYRNIQGKVPCITTIARGIGIGEELEYTDEFTLGRSLLSRTTFETSYSKRS